ncbi:MAG: hypothetical protein AAB268_12990 [Elusimicrobiota bacterium]
MTPGGQSLILLIYPALGDRKIDSKAVAVRLGELAIMARQFTVKIIPRNFASSARVLRCVLVMRPRQPVLVILDPPRRNARPPGE